MSKRSLPPATDAPRPSFLSRRGLLAAAAAVPAGAAVLSAAPAIADPTVTGGETRIVDVPLADAPDRDVEGVGTVRVLAGPATMVGATWEGESPQQIRVRGLSQADGTWGEWYDLDVDEDIVAAEAGEVDEDTGAESAGAGRPSAEPVWLDPVDEIEILVSSHGTDAADLVTAHVMTTSPTQAELSQGSRTFSSSSSSLASTSSRVDTGPNGPTVISRSAWGATESWTRGTSSAEALRGVVLHHTAGTNGYSRASSPQIVRGILSHHTRTLGWADIGYNVLVDRFGQIFEGRKGGLHRNIIGAHALGFNTGTFGISVMGNHQSTQASAAAREAVMSIAAWKLNSTFHVNANQAASWTVGVDGTRWSKGTVRKLPRFFAHRDVNFTDCPGNALYGGIDNLRWGINTRIESSTWRNHYLAFRDGGGASRLGTVTHGARTEGSYTVTRLTKGIVVSGSGKSARARETTASFLSNWSSDWGRPMAHVRQDGDRVVQAFDKGVAARENGRNRFMTRHFADVSPTNAFFLEIGDLSGRGITRGWPDNTFRPLNNCRRDEMIVFLYRAMGSPRFTPPRTSPYTDVSTRAEFYKAITWARSKGYAMGWKEKDGSYTFRPGAPTRRDQVAAFFYRAAGSPAVSGGGTGFTDVPSSHVFAKEIRWMSQSGISRGWKDGTFRPTQPVTREQIAAFFMRWLGVTGRL